MLLKKVVKGVVCSSGVIKGITKGYWAVSGTSVIVRFSLSDVRQSLVHLRDAHRIRGQTCNFWRRVVCSSTNNPDPSQST